MKALLVLMSGAAMIALMSSCSSDADPTILGPGTNPEQSSAGTVNFILENITLGEGMVYSQDIISLSSAMAGDVLVQYLAQSATCECNVDYVISSPNPCCIPAGEMKAAFTIETLADEVTEGEETIQIKLIRAEHVQQSGSVTLGENIILNIIISDNN